jgi:FtsP/CotA-like multicopper oxidase with cupredoxin domain
MWNQLWRILNAATDAFLDLALIDENGKPLPLEVVARDGSSLTDDAGAPLPLAGDIPFHCHLVDHEDNGMMAVLRVRPTLEKRAIPP